MNSLRYVRSALSDLATLRAYIVETTESEFRAQTVIARIDDRCQLLKAFPLQGRPRPEFAEELRSVAVKPIVIFYAYDAEAQTVSIVRVVDGRRDLGTIFFDEF